ncbi:MAG TPA: helix-turn-helix domain-containing protein [Thermoleophilaceae bacterium]
MTAGTGSRQTDRSTATRARLVKAARELFAERPYADVGTEEIVRRARVTRGALYHHFTDKRDLFRAVHEQLEAELVDAIARQLAASAGGDPLEGLRTGVRSYLDACEDPSFARITLIDAPAVLGWVEWRRIDEEYALRLIVLGLEGAMDAGALRRQPVLPMAHLLLGTMGEAGLRVANGEGRRDEVEGALMALLDGLRA